jgi:hypothetical protein
MSLVSNIQDLATRIATEFKTVKTKLSGNNTGDLSSLNTTVKTSLLAAINEVLTEVGTKEDALGFTPEDSSNKGSANGYCPLDSSSKVPAANLPAYVDDVVEYADQASFPATGEEGVIYIAKDTNIVYRWSGTGYVEISSSLALGETSSTAYRGDRGKIAYDHSQVTGSNPHSVPFSALASKPTTLSGFGITDAYTETEIGDVTANFVTGFESALI